MKFLFRTVLLFAFFASLASCKQSTGEKAIVGEAKEVVAKAKNSSTSYGVDLAASKVMWTGSKITGTHSGTISLSSGNILSDNGKITGGEFVLDMNSLTNTDMKAGDGKEDLEGHLKNEDFFDVPKYPTAKFVITKVTALEGDAAATHLVYGNLTMKDVTKEVGFKAKVSQSGGMINVSTPKFAINRTDWGIKYGSSSFADIAKDKAINNDIDLAIKLSAKAQES